MSDTIKTTATALTPQVTLGLSLDGIKLIEASAGTGKTYTIGNLYLRYVLAGHSVAEILVVTFTNAATEELRGRLRARLYQTLRLLQNPQPSDDLFLGLLLANMAGSGDPSQCEQMIDRLKLAVRSMDEAAIYTIHGFCQRALTDHAFNSGQPFDVALINDDSELWHDALKDWWRRTVTILSRQNVALLSESVGSLDQFLALQKPLRQAFGKTLLPEISGDLQTQFAAWQALGAELQAIADEWQVRREALWDILLESSVLSREAKGPYKKEKLQASLESLNAWFAEGELLTLHDDFYILSVGVLHAKSKPKQRGTDAALEDAFFVACQRVLDKREKIQQQLRATALADATMFAREQVGRAKQQAQTISFDDQLTLLHKALHGEPGDVLANSLRQRFPFAMIDEFQDTDALQYGIFRRLYYLPKNIASEDDGAEDAFEQGDLFAETESDIAEPENVRLGLTMIGDPKQAIYSFRGGDIFTYMRAKQDAAGCHYTLDTNWRSVPGLIDAVNTVFSFRGDPFIYSGAIDYQPVRAASETEKGKPHRLLTDAGQSVAPLTLWRIPANDKGKPLSKSRAQSLLAETTAAEIARLLAAGEKGGAKIGDTPLQPGDIAVLVRTGFEATEMREQLQAQGIAAVSVGRDKVFESDEARALVLLLRAVIHCNDRRHARTALGSALLGLDYSTMAEMEFNEARWLAWVDGLRDLNRLWLQRGFMTMFQVLLQDLKIAHGIAAQDQAERRLTNLLHLGELLQQASKIHPGLDALMSWFQQQIEDKGDEEAELRLESDEALVKIVTIHKSKGLEYPVVFLPFLWGCRAPDFSGKLVGFHDAENTAFLDAAVTADSPHLRLAEKERLAEDIRLAYVALTRAQARVYVAWGHVTTGGSRKCDSGATALAYLLHAVQTPDDLNLSLPNAFAAGADMAADLQRLAEVAGGNIEVIDLPAPDVATAAPIAQKAVAALESAQFTGTIATDWRVASFTALTRDVHQVHRGGSPRADDAVLNFPAGSHVGSFLHLLLERLDFQADVEAQVTTLTEQLAPRFNIDVERNRDTLLHWIGDVLATPLDAQGLCLQQIANANRLNEMEFDFSIAGVRVAELNRRLQQVAGQPLPPIEMEDFRGMITGIIDLIFEHDGRFYIADYKSNFLGGALADYAPDALRQAVLDRRYDLQYLLYTLALHRYLRQRIFGYEYSRDFGGVYYLFLRGMRPASGAAFGVHFDRPDEALIDELDQTLLAPQTASEGANDE